MSNYIKLSGQNIIDHVDQRHPNVNPADWDELVQKSVLVFLKGANKGKYKYKYVDPDLVELTQNEIDNHPLNLDNQDSNRFSTARDLILTRVACDEVIAAPQAPQRLKDKATAIKQKANQDLVDLFGL
jgi:hypothetical protein